jgi:hypothetical protein
MEREMYLRVKIKLFEKKLNTRTRIKRELGSIDGIVLLLALNG